MQGTHALMDPRNPRQGLKQMNQDIIANGCRTPGSVVEVPTSKF